MCITTYFTHEVINPDTPGQIHGGLLSELVAQGLDGEAADCCNMLTCLLCHLTPALKQRLSLYMLKCFEYINSECVVEGVLGLDYDSASSSNGRCQTSAACAIDSVTLLDGLLDGSTSIFSMEVSEQSCYRKCLGFSDHCDTVHQNTKSQIGTSEFFELDNDETFGISYRLAISFLATIGIGHNFEDSFKAKHVSTINKLTLSCAQIISSQHSSSSILSKDLTYAANSLSSAIDMGLADAEFVASKFLSSTPEDCLLLIQKMLAGRLYAVNKVLCTLAPCGANLDGTGSFLAFLLKSSKRLYSAHTRLVLSHLILPKSILCRENKQLLTAMSDKLAPRTMNLLLTMQEMSKVGDGKMLADSKIESQGRVAAQVVFEQEKHDNALFKISAKLKAHHFENEGTWIETKVVESTTRDFKIKKKDLQAARDRERVSCEPAKKMKVSKKERKVKTSQNGKVEDGNTNENSDIELSTDESEGDHIPVDDEHDSVMVYAEDEVLCDTETEASEDDE